MAFGFFKKAEKADLIFRGGRIYTQSGDLPWADAVACKDGKILSVGDEDLIMELEGSDTQVIDLEGNYLLPGFIELKGEPEALAFEDSFIDVSGCEDFDSVLGFLSDHVYDHPSESAYFACGLAASFVENVETDASKSRLDGICDEKPLIVLYDDGIRALMNTCALELAKQIAEENGMPFISLPLLINSLELLDFEEIQRKVLELAADSCERGITSILSVGSIDYFTSTYQDILVDLMQNDMLKQRAFSVFRINSLLDPSYLVRVLRQKKTFCVDMDGLINFSGLVMDTRGDSFEYSEDELKALCIDAADAGFDIKAEVCEKETALDVIDAFNAVQNKGYRKNLLTLVHDENFTEDERADFALGELIHELPLERGVVDEADSVTDAIDRLTIDAAILLGEEANLGSIEKGKLADFAIFEKNPLDCATVDELKRLRACMTVVNGKIVYDENEYAASEWYELLMAQQY